MTHQRDYFLEQVDQTVLAQLYVDGFEELNLKDKILAYWLCKAAVSGRDISYDQNHRHILAIRKILEEIITHPGNIEPSVYRKILLYVKQLWIHNGNYDFFTAQKFTPCFGFEELAGAAQLALGSGANPGVENREDLTWRLGQLRKTIFEREHEPLKTNKTPRPGKDMITDSANNYYAGVSLKEVENFKERYPLNSRLAKINGEIIEQVYKAGCKSVKPGLYAQQLKNVIDDLVMACGYADNQQKRALEHLIQYFKTGEPEEFEKYNIAWLEDSPLVDAIIGFIEVYGDARGVKGEYEGVVTLVDEEGTKMMRGLAGLASYFEKKAPCESKYKKENPTPSVANSTNLLVAVGGGGPISFSGVNLPNSQDIRETRGSKNLLLCNVMRIRRELEMDKSAQEFALTQEEKELQSKYGERAELLKVALHEVIGHGSGKKSSELTHDPSKYLRECYSTLEEARADLVALWNIFDESLTQLGLSPHRKLGEACYRNYVRQALVQLRRVEEGDTLEEAHMQAIQLIVEYLRRKVKAVDVVEKDGKIYFWVNDIEKMRRGVGELLSLLMAIKAEGDYAAIKRLVDEYGRKFNPRWRDQVKARARKISLPNYYAFVMPKLELVMEKDKTVDVKITYPRDFVSQQLEFSGMRTSEGNGCRRF